MHLLTKERKAYRVEMCQGITQTNKIAKSKIINELLTCDERTSAKYGLLKT